MTTDCSDIKQMTNEQLLEALEGEIFGQGASTELEHELKAEILKRMVEA